MSPPGDRAALDEEDVTGDMEPLIEVLWSMSTA